ncbi:MAG: 4-hydroxy-tetrahydrodipicolinate synthase [Flavobacteriia bacterium]|nr:MAG: 4-hydroxy-tetrahydrodipicolinate synthase [Flavobacteriia bacterium]
MKTFKGSGVALVTPFQTDGSIDFQALQQLVSLQIKGGTDFLVVQGTTGESPTLSQDEKRKVLDTVLEVNNGQLPIVYGIGGNNTAGLAVLFQNLPSGVDGILSVSPYYNKPIQKGIVAHFKQVASFTDLPIILYNVPGRTGSNMSVETTLELAEIQNVVAVKEASGNMEQIMDIIRQRKPGFGVLSGDDNLTMPLIAAGADGVISVVANAFPERFSQMVHASMEGNLNLAKEAHYDLFNVTKMFFEEGNPGGVKVALAQRGLMQETMRMPLYPVSEGLRSRIQAETKRLLSGI